MSMRRILSLVLAVVMLSAVSLTVLANSQKVDVLFDNITIYLDGKEIKSDTEPFVYNDRTYTPSRLVAEALGATVEWDAKNNRVVITSPKQTAASTTTPTAASGFSSDEAKVLGNCVNAVDSLGILLTLSEINALMFGECRNTAEYFCIWGAVIDPNKSAYDDLISDENDFAKSYDKSKTSAMDYINDILKDEDVDPSVKKCATSLKDSFTTMDKTMSLLKSFLQNPTESSYNNAYDQIDAMAKERFNNGEQIMDTGSDLWKDNIDVVGAFIKSLGNQSSTSQDSSSSDSGDLFGGGLDDLFKGQETGIAWNKELIRDMRSNIPKFDAKKYADIKLG